jgi:hypothetical protein
MSVATILDTLSGVILQQYLPTNPQPHPYVESITAGTGVSVDNTVETAPVVSSLSVRKSEPITFTLPSAVGINASTSPPTPVNIATINLGALSSLFNSSNVFDFYNSSFTGTYVTPGSLPVSILFYLSDSPTAQPDATQGALKSVVGTITNFSSPDVDFVVPQIWNYRPSAYVGGTLYLNAIMTSLTQGIQLTAFTWTFDVVGHQLTLV